MQRTKLFQFRLTDAQHRELLSASTESGVSAAEIARRGLALSLAEQRTEKKETEGVPA
jgi:hypothetical protein